MTARDSCRRNHEERRYETRLRRFRETDLFDTLAASVGKLIDRLGLCQDAAAPTVQPSANLAQEIGLP